MTQNESTSRPLAPEDIRAGMFVATLEIIREQMPYYCEEEPMQQRGEPHRMRWLPQSGDLRPMRVIEVCLPFVLVRNTDGRVRTLDVRRYRLAALSETYGKAAFHAARHRRKQQQTPAKRKKQAPIDTDDIPF